ncbi:TonB-dependent receptor [Larkinella soli]|uniref:TonB-dependent receptor n=1 Tax=Larkinella soli TaxID=1770527 RepID=UPI000FFBE022|nr:TonB-dependent receptor [Larkinella soli]
MKKLLLFVLLLILAFPALAHLGSIVGSVHDPVTRRPLGGVTVHLTGLGKGTVTNELGQYRFDGLVPAPYKIELSHLGFRTMVIEVTVYDDQITRVSTPLDAAAIELKEIAVSSLRAHDQQLISSLDIRVRPITNSQEILRLVPGLFIGQHAGGGKAEQIFLRGFDLDHGTDIRLSVDGIPVNMVSHAHGQGYADLHFVIPELIEGVDFRKGPYRADQGNFATAGWVDFRTRTVLDKSFVKLEAGPYRTARAVGAFDLLGRRGLERGQSLYLAPEYSYSDSYFDHPQHFKRFNLVGKYHRHLSPNTRLTLTGSTFHSRWNHSGQIPDRAVASGQVGFYGSVDPTEGGETGRTNLNGQLVTTVGPNLTLRQQVYYSRYDFELYSNFTFFREDSVNGDQIRQKESRHLFGYNGSIARNSRIGRALLTTTAGLQYRRDLTRPTELSHTLNRSETLGRRKLGRIDEGNASLYLDESIAFSARFTLNTGVRADYLRNRYTDLLQSPAPTLRASDVILSPKLNLYYTVNPRLQLYLNTGRGFHSNDTRVVVEQQGREVLPAAYGSDLGLIFKPFPNLLIQAAGWYLWMEQEFVYVGDEGVIEPSGKSRRYGLDASLRWQLSPRLFFDLDLNTARPRALGAEAGQNYLPLAPTFTSTGGLTLQNRKGLSGSLRYRYMAARPANEDNSIVAKGYFITDLQANYTLTRLQFGLSVQNLFNTRWKETQFATESRLRGEPAPVNEIHFTPGTPFFPRASITYFF